MKTDLENSPAESDKFPNLDPQLSRIDEYRLLYHFHPAFGWMNDPNGMVIFHGEYHVFFQYYPYDSHWGPIHWGHAKSKDLLSWEMLPIALMPSEQYDTDEGEIHGCASGCAFVLEDTIVLVYTGFHNEQQVQCLARSRDGVNFVKSSKNPIIDEYPPDGSPDFRDPHVWKHDNRWYMAIGTKKDDNARVVLYTSNDLYDWDYRGVLLESNEQEGDMWECPDIASIGEKQLLLVSPITKKINGKPIYFLGDMNYVSNRFDVTKRGTLDYGNDFYAPKTFIDETGRTILFAWMENWLSQIPSQKFGWAGAFTLPRELILESDGVLKQRPISELKNRRAQHWGKQTSRIMGEYNLEHVYNDCMEFSLCIDTLRSTAPTVVLQIRAATDFSEYTELKIDFINREVTIDRARSGIGDHEASNAPFRIPDGEKLSLRIFTDTSSVEVFINEGEQVITNRIYPSENSNHARILVGEGIAVFHFMESWLMR